MTQPTPISPDAMPEGEYAMVEILGHRTLVGRVAEVERFGAKLLQVEPLYADAMLGPVLIGGSSVYQFTPCTPEVAYARRAKYKYDLPVTVLATVPTPALTADEHAPAFLADEDETGHDCNHGLEAWNDREGFIYCGDCGARLS